jgi:hypothetical protein
VFIDDRNGAGGPLSVKNGNDHYNYGNRKHKEAS